MKKSLGALVICLLMVVSYMIGRNHKAPHDQGPKAARRVLYWVDPMHPDYKSDHPGTAPDCGMALEPVYAEDTNTAPKPASMTQTLTTAVNIDEDIQQSMAIRTAVVEKTDSSRSVRVLGRVVPEDTRVYRIDAGADGFIRETYDDSVGSLVEKDQKLASCYGPDYLSVASGFLAAAAGVPGSTGKDGNRTMPFPGALSKQGLSSMQGYTDRLRNLGMSEFQIHEMAETHQLPTSIYVVSPATGFILSRNISPGQHYDRSMEFYRIADLSRVWIVADILGSEAQQFRAGTSVQVVVAGKTLTARISNVLPQVDPSTRTLKLRLEAENPGYVLRPDMFVDVELPVARPAGLTVPVDAVIDSGKEQRVFVERSPGMFEPRDVEVGWRFGDRAQILKGLSEGERVVSSGTFLVDSESRLRSLQAVPKEQPNEKLAPKSTTGIAVSATSVKDAACGMTIDKAKAVAEGFTITRDGVTYYFCSDRCKKKFSEQPEHYLAANPSGPHS